MEPSAAAGLVEIFLPMERALWVATLVSETLLLGKLLREKLLKPYAFFSVYLALELIAGVVLLQIELHSWAYARAFRFYEFLAIVLKLGVAWELYSKICAAYPVAGRSRAVLGAVLTLLSGLIAIAVFRPDLMEQWGFPQTFALIVKRFENEIFSLTFVLAWVFFRWIIPLREVFRPNVLVHWKLLTMFFGLSGAAALIDLMVGGSHVVHPINVGMLSGDLICLIVWTLKMSAAGEREPERQYFSPREIQEIEEYSDGYVSGLFRLGRAIARGLEGNRESEPSERYRR